MQPGRCTSNVTKGKQQQLQSDYLSGKGKGARGGKVKRRGVCGKFEDEQEAGRGFTMGSGVPEKHMGTAKEFGGGGVGEWMPKVDWRNSKSGQGVHICP